MIFFGQLMEKYRASWYEGFDHVGYDWRGQKIPRTEAPDNIEKFLDQVDNPDAWYPLLVLLRF